jgi:hypothetical protein
MIREGADPVGGTPEQFGKFTRQEREGEKSGGEKGRSRGSDVHGLLFSR